MALELIDAGFVYSAGTPYETQALDGLSFEVAPGALTVVLGPTGSGKSTLLRLLAGLLEPTIGEVRLDDESIGARVAGRKGGVGLAFQSPESQLFAETVAADVAFGPLNQGLDEETAYGVAHSALERVGLDPEEYGLRSPFALSGGEARRAALAGVLATEPGYLLLDEPTAGLDARGKSAVLDIVATLKEQAGVVVVTHDADHFLPLADHVVLLRDGEVSWSGETRALLQSPEEFGQAGLEPPGVVRAQMAISDAGAMIARPYTLDPHAAARAMWDARGGAA